MERAILIHFDKATGEVKVEALGFEGLSCLEATQPFEEALGIVEGDRTYKDEAQTQQLRSTSTHQTRLRARSLNLPQPKGVLLAGPPGVGKTLLAKNIANILNLPLLQLDIASMLGSLVGESEGNVRRALKTASAIAPCVLWVDEIEKALSGSGDTSGVSQRILGNILTFMSECTAGVFVVATCNDPEALPTELKRKGRFDENFFVDLPTAPERVQILKIHLERFGIQVQQEYLEAIAENTSKFSGAELETLAAEAALLAFDEDRPQQVSLGDLEACCQSITPLAVQDAASVERMRSWAKLARPASSTVQTTTKSLRTPRLRNIN